MFLTYFIKVDKREVLRLYFEHIYVLLVFLDFPGKLRLYRKSEQFWVIMHYFDQLNVLRITVSRLEQETRLLLQGLP